MNDPLPPLNLSDDPRSSFQRPVGSLPLCSRIFCRRVDPLFTWTEPVGPCPPESGDNSYMPSYAITMSPLWPQFSIFRVKSQDSIWCQEEKNQNQNPDILTSRDSLLNNNNKDNNHSYLLSAYGLSNSEPSTLYTLSYSILISFL